MVPRFFQAIGRAMVLADGQQNKGKYRQVISDAFAGHGLALGANAMLAPAVALAGSAPVIGGSKDLTLAAATSRDLRQRLNVPRGVTLSLVATGLADDVAKVRYQAPVSLDDVDSRLAGVVAMADVSVLVGGSGGQAAVLGSLPHPDDNADAVRNFVSSLVAHDQVELPSTNGRSKKASKDAYAGPTTHAVRSSGTDPDARPDRLRLLVRVRRAALNLSSLWTPRIQGPANSGSERIQREEKRPRRAATVPSSTTSALWV